MHTTAQFSSGLLLPDWPAPTNVRAFLTLRSFGDVRQPTVRAQLSAHVPQTPRWLKQVHGIRVIDADTPAPQQPPEADASTTRTPQVVCVVMAADCMPVLLTTQDGQVVAAAHAGWRGLSAGVIESTVAAMRCDPQRVMAWLGPAIGARVYEVGAEVRAAFLAHDVAANTAFVPTRAGHWLLDLAAIARQRLAALGITAVFGGDRCTLSEAMSFDSFRRDGAAAGRMAACVWRV